MTAAFNLAQLANNLNSSGQLDATDGLSGLVANANLASSGTANSSTFLRGDRTWQSIGTLGKVRQVLQTQKKDTFITNSVYPNWVDITGLSVTITPLATSSKILVEYTVQAACTNYVGYLNLKRNSTDIGRADASTNRPNVISVTTYANTEGYSIATMAMQWLDSPNTTSAITYKLQASTYDSTNGYITVNRTYYDRASVVYDPRVVSTITVTEILA